MGEVDVVQSCDLDVSMFEYEIGGDDNDLYVVTAGELADDLLWPPLTEEEPDVEFSLLAQNGCTCRSVRSEAPP